MPRTKKYKPESMDDEDDEDVIGRDHNTKNATGAQLLSYIQRVERLEEEKKATADDIKDVYAEAKSNGFDTKAMKEIVKLRKKPKDKRDEEQSILDTYLHALGMLDDD